MSSPMGDWDTPKETPSSSSYGSFPGSPTSRSASPDAGSSSATSVNSSNPFDTHPSLVERSNTAFGEEPPSQGSGVVSSAPTPILLAASVLAVVGLLVALIMGGATGGLVGWTLAGPVAVLTIGAFLVVDGRRRGTGWYRPTEAATWLLRAAVLLSILAVTTSSFEIANDVARGRWT